MTSSLPPHHHMNSQMTLTELEEKIRRRGVYLKHLVVKENAIHSTIAQKQNRKYRHKKQTQPPHQLESHWANHTASVAAASSSQTNSQRHTTPKTVSDDWVGWIALKITSPQGVYYHADPKFQPVQAFSIGRFREKKLFARRVFRQYMYNVRRHELHPTHAVNAGPSMGEQAVVIVYNPRLKRATTYRAHYVHVQNSDFSHTIKRRIKISYVKDYPANTLPDALKIKWQL